MVERPELVTHYLLSDGVVCVLQVAQHLRHHLLGVAAVAHGVEQIHGPLANAHVAFRLDGRAAGREITTNVCGRFTSCSQSRSAEGGLALRDLITVSMCVFTASWENSELASVHMLSRAK